MIGHSREVLASLGIDVWVPRALPCQEFAQTSIWRDQAPVENLVEHTTITPIFNDVDIQQDPIFAFVDETPLDTKSKTEQEKGEVVVESEIQARPQLQIAPFNIQALILKEAILLIEGSQLTAEQQQLWVNIQKGLTAEYAELNWPFALQALQDGYCVDSYVKGFVDSCGFDKTIIILGHVPHVEQIKAQSFDGLQEMLDQPLLKRKLWQYIRSLIN